MPSLALDHSAIDAVRLTVSSNLGSANQAGLIACVAAVGEGAFNAAESWRPGSGGQLTLGNVELVREALGSFFGRLESDGRTDDSEGVADGAADGGGTGNTRFAGKSDAGGSTDGTTKQKRGATGCVATSLREAVAIATCHGCSRFLDASLWVIVAVLGRTVSLHFDGCAVCVESTERDQAASTRLGTRTAEPARAAERTTVSGIRASLSAATLPHVRLADEVFAVMEREVSQSGSVVDLLFVETHTQMALR
jgi:hypothetical protein